MLNSVLDPFQNSKCFKAIFLEPFPWRYQNSVKLNVHVEIMEKLCVEIDVKFVTKGCGRREKAREGQTRILIKI